MSETQPVLEMRNISKYYPGVVALDHVDLQIRPGRVHALMGENGAGKSTLMKCLFGMERPDTGQVLLDGSLVAFRSSKDALETGISMIHQELSNVPQRSVQENIWLGQEHCLKLGPFRILDHSRMHRETRALLTRLELDVDPDARLGDLSISRQQACEIAKAVNCKAKVVVMDEPTSSISEAEADHLFKIIRGLTAQGVAVIYISHKMSEIFRIADEVTVMRDGKRVGTWPAAELNDDKLIALMVGRDATKRFPSLTSTPGAIRFEVHKLTSTNPRSFQDISFSVCEGEILGIGGLVGAQRTELVEAIFGLRGVASGTIAIDGKDVCIRSSQDAIRHGLALLTEDRRDSGIFPLLSVSINTALAALDRFLRFPGLLDYRRIEAETKKINESMRTKTPSMSAPIQNLSGGNQQKVLVGRWLLTRPKVLILDEPTRGIDVGAKFEIYSIMADLAAQGTSIIMVSSEMPELIAMSHRILVLCAGRATGTLVQKDATQELVMRLASKFIEKENNHA